MWRFSFFGVVACDREPICCSHRCFMRTTGREILGIFFGFGLLWLNCLGHVHTSDQVRATVLAPRPLEATIIPLFEPGR